MAVSNFPIQANSAHPSEPAGPQPNKVRELKREYGSVVFKEMVDQGGTYGADTTNATRRFELTYDGKNFAEGDILDAHNAEALDTFLPFSYRYFIPSIGVDELLTGVHYESFDRDHGLVDATQSRTIVLVVRGVSTPSAPSSLTVEEL